MRGLLPLLISTIVKGQVQRQHPLPDSHSELDIDGIRKYFKKSFDF